MEQSSKTLVVITGPTAVGKTRVAIEMASRLGTEIISADSRQIFREMTIGTAKPTSDELAVIPHHFINSHSIDNEFDVAKYAEEALVMINKLFGKHDYVILCGGSGLYIRAVCEGLDEIPEIPVEIREEINKQYALKGLLWLQNQMIELDPGQFAVMDQKNPQRLIRALEVKIGTGFSIGSFQHKRRTEHPFRIVKVGLEIDRKELHSRIDTRMESMIAMGLFEEAKGLYPSRHLNALQTVGYQEIFDYFEGKYDKDEAIRLLKRNSRRYAKRQMTWFKRDPEIRWFHPGDKEGICTFIKGDRQ